jgi:hypothetical protein
MSRPINLNWTDLETAFERNAPGVESYLDLETGEVLAVVAGQADAAERRLRVAREPERHLRVEPASSREQYRWMERFVVTVGDTALRDRLLIAIDGKGAFRRFKDVLVNYPAERERWFAYRSDLLHCRMKVWLEQTQLEPTNPAPWGEVVPPPEPAELPPRPVPGGGESPGEALRRQAREVIDQIPAVELPSAIVFLEFLRDRGAPALLAARSEEPPAAAAGAAPVAAGADDVVGAAGPAGDDADGDAPVVPLRDDGVPG